ncbi:MAG: flagellar biosynthesis protein FlhF [Epsilonproteobacteria bacterium (ex Lamellibrachia satsuma)]|nr:MAG: flagellar biosynthesis protein FlhF [Epsilonproteobacteria bacterium (ex Lamellibrachia satsuma)]
MINETFVASDPKSAYEQAVKKYGESVELVSAKQVKHDDGKLRSEVVISVPKTLFMKKSFGDISMEKIESNDEEMFLEEIGELKAQLAQMKDGLLAENKLGSTAEEVKSLFMKKGISERWLDEIFTTLIGSSVIEDAPLLVSYLLEEIDELLNVTEEELSMPKVMMLVGPTGVGKTTTIAKLAARYAYLLDRPYKVALMNLDSYKVGAIEQLEHYADIMQIEHISVSSVAEFKEKLESLAEYDVVLVDTAGMSPYDTQKFIKTVEFVNSDIPKNIEVHLVLSATVKYEDMEDIYRNFSFLNPDSVIISKFDETKHLGTLLNFMLLYKLPMSYFSVGQEVPDDLLPASKEYLLEHFIGDVNEG